VSTLVILILIDFERNNWFFLIGTIGVALMIIGQEYIYAKIVLKHGIAYCISSSIIVPALVCLIIWFLEDIVHYGVVCNFILFGYNCKRLDLVVYVGLDIWALSFVLTELMSFCYRSIRKELNRE